MGAKVSAPGGWSQRKLDLSVKSGILSDEMRLRMEALLGDMEGLQAASDGEMVFEEIKAQRTDEEVEAGTVTSSLSPAIVSSSQAPVQIQNRPRSLERKKQNQHHYHQRVLRH